MLFSASDGAKDARRKIRLEGRANRLQESTERRNGGFEGYGRPVRSTWRGGVFLLRDPPVGDGDVIMAFRGSFRSHLAAEAGDRAGRSCAAGDAENDARDILAVTGRSRTPGDCGRMIAVWRDHDADCKCLTPGKFFSSLRPPFPLDAVADVSPPVSQYVDAALAASFARRMRERIRMRENAASSRALDEPKLRVGVNSVFVTLLIS